MLACHRQEEVMAATIHCSNDMHTQTTAHVSVTLFILYDFHNLLPKNLVDFYFLFFWPPHQRCDLTKAETTDSIIGFHSLVEVRLKESVSVWARYFHCTFNRLLLQSRKVKVNGNWITSPEPALRINWSRCCINSNLNFPLLAKLTKFMFDFPWP